MRETATPGKKIYFNKLSDRGGRCEVLDHSLQKSERFFEVPLDSMTGNDLRAKSTTRRLPPWPYLKRLKLKQSDAYQAAADERAAQMGIQRVHLDAYIFPG